MFRFVSFRFVNKREEADESVGGDPMVRLLRRKRQFCFRVLYLGFVCKLMKGSFHIIILFYEKKFIIWIEKI